MGEGGGGRNSFSQHLMLALQQKHDSTLTAQITQIKSNSTEQKKKKSKAITTNLSREVGEMDS